MDFKDRKRKQEEARKKQNEKVKTMLGLNPPITYSKLEQQRKEKEKQRENKEMDKGTGGKLLTFNIDRKSKAKKKEEDT